MKIHSQKRELLSDKVTPVELYLKMRDRFPGALLLESGDYHGSKNSLSYLCFSPIASFIVEHSNIIVTLPGETSKIYPATEKKKIPSLLHDFVTALHPEENDTDNHNGVFGYTSFESAALFDRISLNESSPDPYGIPLMRYHFYRYVIVIDHHHNRMSVIENRTDGEQNKITSIIDMLNSFSATDFPFRLTGKEEPNMSDNDFISLVQKGKSHCSRGDVFQIVLSRRFSRSFSGDEFNVYRTLRYINPSPWMFFFDYGEYRIFGSSPESQILINDGKASINPIAGTYKRTGNDREDMLLAGKLLDDPKERAEHVMLVDLARNDLSRHSRKVTVNTFKEIQFYSHVLHMVSSVTGEIPGDISPETIYADTFPAGTLSGAPKIKAIELISRYEPHQRSFYGGAIGKIGFDNGLSHAITIRSFMSRNNTLFYQAGAGIVDKSDEMCELMEVNNKLGALRNAMKMASELNK
ncbi:MAG TPA: anthranilate synthase component I family protein [Bacteroidales bacterium]|nr:anthranilate synthase component I family protein [Bacteroidales bacterium]